MSGIPGLDPDPRPAMVRVLERAAWLVVGGTALAARSLYRRIRRP